MKKITTMKGLLPLVRRPARYIGGEINSVKKELDTVGLKFALAFPDAYELGMSHLGFQVLYTVLNNESFVACERVFAPWVDMEALMRERSIPLSTLESGIPLSECDIIGFSLQYELSYTNILSMLDLGNVTLKAKERAEREPFVIAGGPVAFNVEPMAEFFDAVLLGDGERAVVEISEVVRDSREKRESRRQTLLRLSAIAGVYIPSFFEVIYNDDNTVKEIKSVVDGYTGILKRTEPSIEPLTVPLKPIVPFAETVHDRVSVEIMRGCTRGCRFCQAGMIYRPARERSAAKITSIVETELKNTGYDEASLLSLSTGDYTKIEGLLTGLMCDLSKERVSMSLPSLRVGTLSRTLASEIARVRKTGFTLAPEAGTDRLRLVINKGITEEDLLTTAEVVFSLGWRGIKLYFMVGLPTETEDDLLGIVQLGAKVRRIGKRILKGAPQVSVSVTTFIPKPFTPFQWHPQMELGKCKEVHSTLRKRLRSSGLDFKWNDPGASILEGVFSRGDRRLSAVIERAFEKGARFDGWSEELKEPLWDEAFTELGIEKEFYTHRERSFDEVLPWQHLSPGVTKEFLISEHEKAVGGTDDALKSPGVTPPGVTKEFLISEHEKAVGVAGDAIKSPGVTPPGVTKEFLISEHEKAVGVAGDALKSPGVTPPGVTKEFLISEHEKAVGGTDDALKSPGVTPPVATPDCKVESCSYCGVCDFKIIKNVLAGDEGKEAAEGTGATSEMHSGVGVDVTSLKGVPAGSQPAEGTGATSGMHSGVGVLKGVPAGSQPAEGTGATSEMHSGVPAAELPLCYTIRYSRLGTLRFLGHLELLSLMKRSIKRAGLPVIYSKGFHPMQRLSFPDPLPVGIESLDESFGIELDGARGRLSPEEILERLNSVAPVGIKFLTVSPTHLKLSRASGSMEVAEYTIFLKEAPYGFNIDFRRIDRYLRDFAGKEAVILSIVKKGKVKEVDMKRLVDKLELVDGGSLRLVLRKGSGVSLRPSDVLVHFFNFSPVETPLIPILKTRSVTCN